MVSATTPPSFQQLKILIFFFILYNLKVTFGLDTISIGRPLYRNETLISKGGKFELGFFSPGSSNYSYVGIWYKDISYGTIVWVANRETPIRHFAGNPQLVLAEDGNLKLYSDLNNVIWDVNISVANKGVLLDDGNFILTDGLSIKWQSFDYPTDTWLLGAHLGIDERLINKRQLLTSWKNVDDPALGDCAFGMDPKGSPEFILSNKNTVIAWRSGVWNGDNFSSFSNALTNFSYIIDSQAKYFTFNTSISTTARFVLTPSGQINQLVWVENDQDWSITLSQTTHDVCNIFAICGANGFCNISSRVCECLKGFEPRIPENWQSGDWSSGCIRTKPLQCSSVGFFPMSGISMTINSQSLDLQNAQVCQFACLNNCSCTAYAYNGGRCSLWTGDLLDSQALQNSQGVLFVKSMEALSANKKQSNFPKAAIITIPLIICILLAYLFWRIWRKKHNTKEAGETNENLLLLNLDISSKQKTESNNITTSSTLGDKENLSLRHFSFSSICAATNNFATANKLGEGGFGPVYKGDLFDGHSVAVKRLSKRSGQGLEELRNETVLISKLQHRNLVRLLGCCIEQEEKILIYEYMPNKSLDYFLFG
ncbi:hypothetical protein AgCh_020287 [Apium graveolens]